jgi:signal transduction histidine kinase
MSALGKLSAGLAHELNNPAAAARRAAENLKNAIHELREAHLRLDQAALTTEQRASITQLERDWMGDHPPSALDSLERGDREEELGSWLDQRGIERPWERATDLVDAGCDLETLAALATRFEGDVLEHVIARLTASFTISRLASEIESSTTRISELVRAVKEYSYMDQAPQQEIDIHDGIESTLIMLGHRLRQGISITREYDRSLPKISAYGSELNQVWTNLIDNAIDAMSGKGELCIRTVRELDKLLVEVRDNGPGIPEEIRSRIFEPFFTTKGVGKGTGLGLDAVFRIVKKHQGEVCVSSQPGNTRFQVRLRLAAPAKGETK